MDSELPGSSVQSRILEWVAMPSSRGPLWPRDWTLSLCLLHWQTGSLPLDHLVVKYFGWHPWFYSLSGAEWGVRIFGITRLWFFLQIASNSCKVSEQVSELLPNRYRSCGRLNNGLQRFISDLIPRNRLKGLDLIDSVPDELWMEVHDIGRRQGSRPSPRERSAKKQNGYLSMPYK